MENERTHPGVIEPSKSLRSDAQDKSCRLLTPNIDSPQSE